MTVPQKKNVTSYGVICCRINNTSNHMETLLISKRYTYEYFEFVQGKKFTIGKKIPTNVIMSMLNKLIYFFFMLSRTFCKLSLTNACSSDKLLESRDLFSNGSARKS